MKLFLFDFDGVILDLLPIAIETYNHLFKKHGIDHQFDRESFTNLFLGNFHDGLSKIIPQKNLRETILKKRAEEYIRRQKEFQIFEGISKVLSQLSSAGNIVVISSNDTAFIKGVIQYHSLAAIAEVIGGDIEKSKVIKIKQQKEKYPEADIYYIGDTTGDIQEGKKAGVKTVGVTWGFHGKEQIQSAQPDFIAKKPENLISLLG